LRYAIKIDSHLTILYYHTMTNTQTMIEDYNRYVESNKEDYDDDDSTYGYVDDFITYQCNKQLKKRFVKEYGVDKIINIIKLRYGKEDGMNKIIDEDCLNVMATEALFNIISA